jgi:hypothetical protein
MVYNILLNLFIYKGENISYIVLIGSKPFKNVVENTCTILLNFSGSVSESFFFYLYGSSKLYFKSLVFNISVAANTRGSMICLESIDSFAVVESCLLQPRSVGSLSVVLFALDGGTLLIRESIIQLFSFKGTESFIFGFFFF